MINICVLMSTYNGERFIQKQIDSIFNQKDVNVHLVVRDDGSNDCTKIIVNKYISAGYNLRLIEGDNHGPIESFLDLIFSIEGFDYYALADQDDIWYSEKLISGIRMLNDYSNYPSLYYSAVSLIDENDMPIAKLYPLNRVTKKNVFFGFYATGCTIIYNAQFRNLLLRYRPKGICMHDAWLVTVACFLGKVICDERSFIGYRQHSNNVVGMIKKRNVKEKIYDFFIKNRYRHSILARELLVGYSDLLNEMEELQLLHNVANYCKNISACIDLLCSSELKALSRSQRNSVIRQILLRVF